MKYLVEAGVIGVRRCKKEDLRRIAAATGGTLLPNLADLEVYVCRCLCLFLCL